MSAPKRDGDPESDDRGYLPGIPNLIRKQIGRADDLALQELTQAEYERMANAEQSIEHLGKAKDELVRKVLARHDTDWRLRLTSLEKDCLDRGDVAEDSLQSASRVKKCLRKNLWSTTS
jgi:hypothetical protein